MYVPLISAYGTLNVQDWVFDKYLTDYSSNEYLNIRRSNKHKIVRNDVKIDAQGNIFRDDSPDRSKGMKVYVLKPILKYGIVMQRFGMTLENFID